MYISYYGYSTNDQTIPLTPLEFLDKELVPIERKTPIKLYMQLKAPPMKLLNAVLNKIKNHTIACLDLSNNELNNDHAEMIASALQVCNIGRVILTGNHIQDTGAIAFADAIKLLPKVLVELNKNRIGPQGAAELTEAYALTNARKIDLSNNQLGDEGAELVGLKLQENAGKIEHLILKHNGITKKGDRALSETVPMNIAITHRVKQVSFMVKHPIWTVLLCILFLPLLLVFPFIKCEIDVQGCEYEQKRRVISS